ncbi:hypothetical protein D3227_10565 [Mesorhizobium waimense]|uniref:Uncharacterized protein n=1 Tax=Mesorhizobium waimense TaxID=1300307 RepID=A0A3A5L589_9HYPH|nr:hypothetical protein D3227_10565 [Mesorhizobium waimense]
MQGIDLAAALALPLVPDAPGKRQRQGEDLGNSGCPASLRVMSRITAPSMVRSRLSARLARLNCLAWA